MAMMATTATMKAVRIHQYGGPEVLRYEDVPRPGPIYGDALVRIHAAGVNPGDCKVRSGHAQTVIPQTLPLIPGWDLSGVVEGIAAGVTQVAVGDEVYGRAEVLRNGAYAEYIAVRAADLAKKPRSIDHIGAAAVPLAGMAAWQALIERAGLVRGQKVLVHGAAGGVGTFAVQLALWKGATVIGTASARNESFLRELGVHEVVNYACQRFEEVVRDVDVVLDTIGGETLDRSWQVLRPGGVLVSTTSVPSEKEAKQHRVRGVGVIVGPSARRLAELARVIDDGAVRPIVSEVLPLSDARKAHELSQTGHARGKIMLRVAA